MASTYRWMLLDAGAAPVPLDQSAGDFPTQADAEAWLGDTWPELAESGVAQVTLMCDEEPVYGPMSLSPE